MNDQDSEEGDEEGGGGINPEVLRSYLVFAKRAIRQRWIVSAIVFGVGAVLTVVVYKNLPRTYSCQTKLLGVQNEVLEGRGGPHPLAGASELIMQHENLERIIHDEKLIKKFEAHRPPLSKLKDEMTQSLVGESSEEAKIGMLVGTLESRLEAKVEGNILTVNVSWGDGETAADIAKSAREGFIQLRHASEVSAFQEKMDILDGHASKLRDEIEQLAQQIKTLHEEQLAEVNQAKSSAVAVAASSRPALVRAAPKRADLPDFDLPVLKEKLDAKNRRLTDIQAEHDRSLRAEQAKLAELKLKFAPSHPEVITQDKRVAMAMQEPPELALLRAETRSLQDEVEQRQGSRVHSSEPGGAGGGSLAPRVGAVDPLPTDIVKLLDDEELDPALSAQLSGAITKYGTLRSEIRSSRIDLDTAQAAFNHRYRVLVPADVPSKPIKPKPAVVIGGGLFAVLLLALLIPILAELRRGIITARWQVEQIRLPVLAELRLPPHSTE